MSFSKRMGSWIVPAQVAVSITLLASATLLGGTFLRLLLEDSGFQLNGLVLAEVDLTADKPTDKQATQEAQRMVDELEKTPGVEAAAAMSLAPLMNSWSAGHYFSLGEHGEVHSDLQAWGEIITPGFFKTMGTRILEGREPEGADSSGDPVCVINESTAAFFFPKVDAVGKFIYQGGADPSKDGPIKAAPENNCRVIGVAADARFRSLREAPPRMLYRVNQHDDFQARFALAVRSRSIEVAAAAIHDAHHHVAPSSVQPKVITFNELVRSHLRRERMLMALSVSFAAIALLLTGLGLYGLLARSVILRTRELGLRLALGARPRDALLQVIGRGLRLVLIGLAIGVMVALGVTRLLRGLLFGVQPADPMTLIIAPIVLLFVAVIASFVPAWRATKVNPMEALRYE